MKRYWSLPVHIMNMGNELLKSDDDEAGLANIELAIETFELLFTQFPDTDLKERIYFRQALTYQRNGSDEYLNIAIRIYKQLIEEIS